MSMSKLDRAFSILRSPKTAAYLKLGAAVIGVVHAVDEIRKISKKNKTCTPKL